MNNFIKIYKAHKLWVDTAGESGEQISLDGIDMHDIPMKAPFLEQGFFTECNFRGIVFDNMDFYQSEFYSCDFSKASFSNCDFRKATLDFSIFTDAIFTNCRFSRTDAYETIFDKCVFSNCSFVGFNLMKGSMNDARCESTDFDDAYLDKVSMNGIVFINPINADKFNHISIRLDNHTELIEDKDAIKWIFLNSQSQ